MLVIYVCVSMISAPLRYVNLHRLRLTPPPIMGHSVDGLGTVTDRSAQDIA